MISKEEREAILKRNRVLYPCVNEKIEDLRWKILIHSITYYTMDIKMVDDYTWAMWARELVKLQNKHPKLSRIAPLYEEFRNFDGYSGRSLPIRNPKYVDKAKIELEIFLEEAETYYQDL